MDDCAIVAAQRIGLRRFYAALVGAPDTRVEHGDGWQALVTPAAKAAPFFNAVVYDDGAAIAAALPTLDALYVEAGVMAWTVWVHHDDPETAAACERAGHELANSPALMGGALAELDLERRHAYALDHDPDWRTIGRLNGLGYGAHPEWMGSVIADIDEPALVRVVALVDGEPRACAAGLLHEDTCYVGLVATDPAARRRGLAGECTAAVLRAARAAGATTTTLDATTLGEPVYERMGYRTVGRTAQWERRRD
jgi:ribosomal protein S18 acetylase RimI-like enzyme